MTDGALSLAQHGYRTPLHLALTQPVTIAGVPRDLCILWWSVIFAALVAGLVWYSLPIGLGGHWGFQRVTKGDPYWLIVLRRHTKYKSYYHG